MKIKICGVRNIEMLETCLEQQVDYIGLNFVPSSRRRVSGEFLDQLKVKREKIKDNNLSPRTSNLAPPKLVGVFMNQSFDEIANALQKFDLDIIQLHGDESVDFCQRLKKAFPEIGIWKVIGVGKYSVRTLKQQIKEWSSNCSYLLFDNSVPGSGQRADISTLKEVTSFCDKLAVSCGIAGGINAENIEQFMEDFPKASFFDTASGVEKEREFCEEELGEFCRLFYGHPEIVLLKYQQQENHAVT